MRKGAREGVQVTHTSLSARPAAGAGTGFTSKPDIAGRQAPRGRLVRVEGPRPLEGQHARQRAELRAPLAAAAADGGGARVRPRQVAGGHRGGGGRAAERHLDGVHHGQRASVVGVAQHDHALDGRQPVAARVVGEVRVGLDREVQAPPLEAGRLDVESPVRGAHAEHAGGQAAPLGVEAERGLDRLDALVPAEQGLDVPARQHARLAQPVTPFRLKYS
jgi:hypothetical protein